MTLPIVAVIYAGAIGSIFWLDFIYGLAIVAAVPTLLMKLMA